MFNEETIVALATPAGNSGVAVIRVSGDKSYEILQKITHSTIQFEPRKMYLKDVYIDDIVDSCLVVYFHAPFSFTGEDVIEIQSHGGYFLANKVIAEVVRLGARIADRGEFSKRAFVNGKISLDQAEGIIDMINAESTAQAKAGSELLVGGLKDKISAYQDILTDVIAELEAKIDYPEYDFEEDETATIKDKLLNLSRELNSLIDTSKTGLIIKNGVSVAMVGAPNVGKSSLLNALTNSNKAIVTAVAGTTRDVIEAEYEYNGIIFRLFDTAGIHESKDEVEKIGIERAKHALASADLVLKLSEINSPCSIETNKPSINVLNKIDEVVDLSLDADKIEQSIKSNKYLSTFLNDYENAILISAKAGYNVENLKNKIFNMSVSGDFKQTQFTLTNTRHIDCISRAISHIDTAIEKFDVTSMDILSSDIRSAWLALGEVSGVNSNEEIINRIFEKFCLGK